MRLHNVDGIVANLLAVADDVHVVHARLIVVFLFIDVDDVVLVQQLGLPGHALLY